MPKAFYDIFIKNEKLKSIAKEGIESTDILVISTSCLRPLGLQLHRFAHIGVTNGGRWQVANGLVRNM